MARFLYYFQTSLSEHLVTLYSQPFLPILKSNVVELLHQSLDARHPFPSAAISFQFIHSHLQKKAHNHSPISALDSTALQ